MAYNWLMRLFAMFKPGLQDIVAPFGRNRKASNTNAKKLLNRQPRKHEEAILAALTNNKKNHN